MGASQGKSKKEMKEEAREWAITKENEVAELYAQNTELRNQILMMQEDMRALRDMLKGQQSALNESVKHVNERMTGMENDVKEEAREWAITKENEVAERYAQNTELCNQILMIQEDMRALRDMLKGQQSALNESVKQVKQVNERMTGMENDVKVVPFCGYGGHNIMPLSSISSAGEQEIYYRNQIDDGGKNYRRPWDDDKKRNEYNTSYMWFGRVYSLKQFEKVYVDELKFKKITANQYREQHSRWCSYGGNPPYLHGYPKTGNPTSLFPQITNVPHPSDDGTTSWFFKRNHFEPDEE